MSAWTRQRPTAPGEYLCRFVPGYEFVVTVDAALVCTWKGRDTDARPVRVGGEFWDRAEWHVEGVPVLVEKAGVAL